MAVQVRSPHPRARPGSSGGQREIEIERDLDRGDTRPWRGAPAPSEVHVTKLALTKIEEIDELLRDAGVPLEDPDFGAEVA